MSQTVTIDGLEYSVENIKAKVEPVGTLYPGSVVSYDSRPYVVVQRTDKAIYLQCLERPSPLLLGTLANTLTGITRKSAKLLAPSVEEYYKPRLEAEYQRGLEDAQRAFARAAEEATSNTLTEAVDWEGFKAWVEELENKRKPQRVSGDEIHPH